MTAIKVRPEIQKDSFSMGEKLTMLKGMMLTRATDNALKHLFLSGEIVYKGQGFQGKGFRSLGQEAIYGAALRLKRGPTGDVVAPLIRDMGVFLAMSGDDVETAINAQAGKVGMPCDGRDLHLGDFSKNILTPAAPLAIATCTLLGLALSFKQKKEPRVAISFIGEGGCSLGEWHEAVNFASVMSLPLVFCIQNNQIALSTKTNTQSRVRSFADKALGYGICGLSIDGNDVEEVASTFSQASEIARTLAGPVLIELKTMRMCGHAHHDDMLYLGRDPSLSFDIEGLVGGYADPDLFESFRKKDPLKLYEKKLISQRLITKNDAQDFKEEAQAKVNQAVENIKKRSWPQFSKPDDQLIFKKPWRFSPKSELKLSTRNFSKDGSTYLQAIAFGVKEAFIEHKNCLMLGEDVAPPYGNAFMMFKGMDEFAHRFINTPISENAIVGACAGLAMGGFLPIGEMQFNDFVACAMDQVCNNVAKSFFRTAVNMPLVLRMPYGGLRRAGPYHSQDTSAWFYRTPGLKIMAPSTPNDAMNMLLRAVRDPDPVMFYEHIGLYRDPKIKQQLSIVSEAELDGAALINEGSHLSMISYGAFCHVAKRAAKKLEEKGFGADVIDLRYLSPIDFATVYASIKKCGRALLVAEDSVTGGILQSVASKVGQDLFEYLDAPVVVLGSKDTPVPYAPSLEDEYLLSEQRIIDEALQIINF